MTMLQIYVKSECKNMCHGEGLPINPVKSAKTNNESHFYVPVWLPSTGMDKSKESP